MTSPPTTNQFTIDPTGQKKLILSIDGGGMRGTISVAMLAELEAQTGRSCADMFDFIAGTSTGAVIAAGLAAGLSAAQILEQVYFDRLPRAFAELPAPLLPSYVINALGFFGVVSKKDKPLFTRLLGNGLRFAYPLEPFAELLTPLVGCRRVGELTYPENPIFLLTTKDMSTGNTYFIVNDGRGSAMFADWTLTAAVGASGAAPVYFPPVLNRLVDGGVGVFMNPCLAAAVEAMEYIGQDRAEFRDGNVIHVSLGTGYVPNVVKPDAVRRFWVLDWLRYIIDENLDDASLQQTLVTRAIYGRLPGRPPGRTDFRRYNPLLTRESVADALGIDLTNRPDPHTLRLDSFQEEQITLMADIGRAYARRIDWSTPDLMPWDTPGGHRKAKDVTGVPIDFTGTTFDC